MAEFLKTLQGLMHGSLKPFQHLMQAVFLLCHTCLYVLTMMHELCPIAFQPPHKLASLLDLRLGADFMLLLHKGCAYVLKVLRCLGVATKVPQLQ
eukprot:CAMPEP_0172905594 /NCGR_PEP_ID=MMETSP1075-20121228/174981_1 /TAXON_ID=2916 /ORGANISM="Ceratium fusus, Strain PA161109" /LENGTH=94 /DNA_ID=CAMNT_0013762853 /DNA_START=78 /DNA_END=362 /DNA_ORIENTATION=+